jgi:formiminotetrahydrofolate cyclodeaminase
MRSAWLNVTVNTVSISDAAFALRVNGEGTEFMRKYVPRAEHIYEDIEKRYRRADEEQEA